MASNQLPRVFSSMGNPKGASGLGSGLYNGPEGGLEVARRIIYVSPSLVLGRRSSPASVGYRQQLLHPRTATGSRLTSNNRELLNSCP